MMREGPDGNPHLQFDYPRSRAGVRLAVVADAHVTPTHGGTWKVLHRTERRLAAALRAAEGLGVDAVLMPGDLTKDGTSAQFEAVERLVSSVSVPVLSVPGNHDRVPPPAVDDSGHVPGWVGGPSTVPFHDTVGDIDVLGLDTATASTGSDGGYLPDSQLRWLAGALDSADRPVVMTHHPLGIDWTGLETVFPSETFHVANASAVRERLARTDALVVAGHVHWPIAQRADDLREIVAPPTCSYPQAICVLHITDGGTRVQMRAISTESDRREALEHLRSDPVLDGAYLEMAKRDEGVSDTWVRNVGGV